MLVHVILMRYGAQVLDGDSQELPGQRRDSHRALMETKRRRLDVRCYRHFMQPGALPIPDFNSTYVSTRIRSFLSRFGDGSVVFEDQCVAGITRVVAYIVTEILEMANRHSREADEPRTKIVPSDVRIVVYLDPQLRMRLQFSTVYWEGRTARVP
ncbi:hypothetical protein VTK56DRAFT_8189 [Thermocarpiscus australiensis]